MTTPSDLDVLLHYHVCPEPHPRAEAPAVRDAIERFMREDILEFKKGVGFVTTTKRGRLWVEMLLATPPPESAYVDPRTGELLEHD